MGRRRPRSATQCSTRSASACGTSRSPGTASLRPRRPMRMTALRILSGGAAQGLVGALAPQLEAETGFRIEGEFGAVGAMAAKLRAGAPADLLILAAALIAELTREGRVAEDSAADVGTVL